MERQYETCYYGQAGHLVEKHEFNYTLQMCHACAKFRRWEDQRNLLKANVRVELIPNGHWKAFWINKSGMMDLIASGHIKQELYSASDVVVRKLITDSIKYAIEKFYVPDEKYIFHGDMRVLLFDLPLDSQKVGSIIMMRHDKSILPTLRMKAANWKLWLPKVDKDNPQLRGAIVADFEVYESPDLFTRATKHNGNKVENAVLFVPQTSTPFCPHSLHFLREGRFTVYLTIGTKGVFTIDVDVTEKAGRQ